MRAASTLAGLAVLALLWSGAVPAPPGWPFAAHMGAHMAVVALAAPLIAIALTGTRAEDRIETLPGRRWMLSPLTATMLEFAIVWGWHMPALHHAARQGGAMLLAEQGSFLVAGLALWFTCFSRANGGATAAALVGTLGLLLTSMHMTLLGALIAFASRPLYGHGRGDDPAALLADQQLGGVIMLTTGGLIYLAGGLVLMARVVLADPLARQETAP